MRRRFDGWRADQAAGSRGSGQKSAVLIHLFESRQRPPVEGGLLLDLNPDLLPKGEGTGLGDGSFSLPRHGEGWGGADLDRASPEAPAPPRPAPILSGRLEGRLWTKGGDAITET